MIETVNHPTHYGGDTIYETIKVLEAWLTPEQFIGFCRGNALKYLSRADKKGDAAENKQKADFYIQYELDFRRRLAIGDIGEQRALNLALTMKFDKLIDGLRSVQETVTKSP